MESLQRTVALRLVVSSPGAQSAQMWEPVFGPLWWVLRLYCRCPFRSQYPYRYPQS